MSHRIARSVLLLALAAGLVASTPALAQKRGAQGGSEEEGGGEPGTQTEDYQATICSNPFEDVSGSGTAHVLDDDEGVVVPLGFTFEYFGVAHAQVAVSSNGYLTFGGDLTDFTSTPLPNADEPNDLIAPYWDDWAPNEGGTVHTQTLGSAPSRRFVAQWTDVPHYSEPGTATFQAVLFEQTGAIEFHYVTPLTHVSPSVGLENPDGTEGLDLSLIFPNPNLVCLRFDPTGVSSEPSDLACEEFDRTETLTPSDTLTLVTSTHNPQQEQGYLYVYAVDAAGEAIGFDWLIGQELVVDGLETFQYSMNAVDYRAAVAEGEATDLDGDGVRDLDGVEYEETAGEILVPRFLGTDSARGTRGSLILIALSGGTAFTTTADFLVYNDDEDPFSASHTFFCWDKLLTVDVSQLFYNDWLTDFSGQDPAESLGALEYGWFSVDGGVASSTAASLLDPAIYAVYVEQVGGTAAADLPFERGAQAGHLLPRLVTGDNSEGGPGIPVGAGVALPTGRKPGSLLLFPEFDNRAGVATVVTVTNVNPTEAVRAHFVYVGRFGG